MVITSSLTKQRPNKRLHPTPLRGEQDRCNFEIQNQPVSCTVLSLAARVKRKPFGGV
jgi:hypothetical protein